MLNIGNKKLKDANIGTTPLDSIYLGSTLIWKKEYVQWYDPEFKRVILEKYNNGKEMTQDQLNKITSLDPNLFAYNKKLLSIKDLEKFINITILPKQLCIYCSNLGSVNLESTGSTDDHILEIPNNIQIIDYELASTAKYSGIKFNSNIILGKSEQVEASIIALSNLSGILDLSNVIKINSYKEFRELGSNGIGLQIIYPYNTNIPIFQGWFQKCNIKSFAPSKEQLEDNKIKLPEGITEITPLAFGNNRLNNFSVYIPNSVTKISGLFAKESFFDIKINIKLLDIGSGCKYIQGDSGLSINNNYTIVCRAINPPLLTIGSNIYKNDTVGYIYALEKYFPFNCNVKHIYVPDESVDLYKNDTKYGIQESNSDIIIEHTGTVECWDGSETKERNISWSRFKDIIKPLSEYVEP